MKVGLPVRANLITRSGEVYNGTIQAVGTRIDPVTRTLTVRAEIPNSDLKLIPGSTFSISVQLPGQTRRLCQPSRSEWDRQGAFVWRVTEANTVERVNVAILGRDGDLVNLDASERRRQGRERGWQSLRDGQTVRPQGS